MTKEKELAQKAADDASFLLGDLAELEKELSLKNQIAAEYIKQLKHQAAELYSKIERINYLAGE